MRKRIICIFMYLIKYVYKVNVWDSVQRKHAANGRGILMGVVYQHFNKWIIVSVWAFWQSVSYPSEICAWLSRSKNTTVLEGVENLNILKTYVYFKEFILCVEKIKWVFVSTDFCRQLGV